MLYLYHYRTNNIIMEDKITLFDNYFQFKVDGMLEKIQHASKDNARVILG